MEKEDGDRVAAGETQIGCDGCKSVFTLLLENDNGFLSGELAGYDNVDVAADPAKLLVLDDPGYDPDPDPPKNPSLHVKYTLADVRQVLESAPEFMFGDTLLRMAFIQQFAALEAYLTDTLINQVLNNAEALKRSVSNIGDLKNVTVSLKEVTDDPEIVKKKCVAILRNLVYHNLSKINEVYKSALNIEIFPWDSVKVRMNKAVSIRHDCVHRNGRDMEGNEVRGLDKEFVYLVDNDILDMISHIDRLLEYDVDHEDYDPPF